MNLELIPREVDHAKSDPQTSGATVAFDSPARPVSDPARDAPTLHVERFWSAYFRTSLLVLIGEIAVAIVYLLLTPNGPHRVELVTCSFASIAIAISGLFVTRRVARSSWRSDVYVAWILYAGVVITFSCFLDQGIDSPLVVLFVLPLAAAALGLSIRNVIVCGVATLVELMFVWITDPYQSSTTADTSLLAATIVGMAIFAFGITLARSRMQRDQLALERELTLRAERDSLTNCLNHGAFYSRLSAEIDRSTRHDESLSLLMIDVDLFKSFNDAHGHVAGDDALVQIARVLGAASRSFDVVGRIGGDEFSIILPGTTSSDALTIASRVRDSVARECAPVTISIGTATLGEAKLTATQLVRAADANLYLAKANGRDQVSQADSRRSPVRRGPSERSISRPADIRNAQERVREADRATLEALSVLDAYQSTTSVGLGFVDTDFRIVRINSMLAAVNGSSVEDQIGRLIEEVVPELWPQLEREYRSVLDSANPVVNLEVSGFAPDEPDVTRWWLTNLYPVTVAERVIGIGIVVLDITDRKRFEQSQVELTRSMVGALAGAAEMRDPYTAGHEDRVATNAALVATALGLNAAQIESITLAGRIHDIGKLAIPAEILARPGHLGTAEMDLIRTHAQVGSDMLKRVHFPDDARDIVLQHHERIDGSGYPEGLRGDEVCMGAQIVAVADVFDAMASSRPYRAALGVEVALEELVEGAGTRYNREVVDSFVRLVREGVITA
jgi:diguanylate cyclase (GGDEF)-like protein/putative nucleotidyltransferase with HDIG domain/PAS domain S-box-containing protein